MNLHYLREIRIAELEATFKELEKINANHGSVLEIGAGSGWQAQAFSNKGYNVKAIDIKSSNYLKNSIWPVLEYDGYKIPFPDEHFDIVFSSNVLEHIPHIESFQSEIARVLKNDGIALHLVPSANWRLWTNITHYLNIIKTIVLITARKISSIIFHSNNTKDSFHAPSLSSLSFVEIIRNSLIPCRHGESGNSLTELYYFSNHRWSKLFTKTGWKIKKHTFCNLTYSGYLLLYPILTISIRKTISAVFGSSCHVYILEKTRL